MSDISYSVNFRVAKDNLSNQVQVGNITASMSKVGYKSLTYSLSTATAAISTAGLSQVGLAFIRNLSTASASTAQIGIYQGGSFISVATLRAGEAAITRLSTGTEYVAIGTAGTQLRLDVTEG
jgi:hypothetical protein